MNECSTVVRALPLRQNYRQRLWRITAIVICSQDVLILDILSVMQRLLLPEQRICGFIALPQMVPSTDIPNTDGNPVQVENQANGHSLN